MRWFLLLFSFFPFFLYAQDYVVLYWMGGDLEEIERAFTKRGIKVQVFKASKDLETHLQRIEMINKEGCLAFLSLYVEKGENDVIFCAIDEAQIGKGFFLSIEEVPSLYFEDSKKIAKNLSSVLHLPCIRVPLFPLLGIKAPGLFLYVRYKERETLEKICAILLDSLKKLERRRE